LFLYLRVKHHIQRRSVMAEAVIVEAVRSPVGKRNGGLSGVHPGELSAQVLNGLAERAGIDPEIVDDVIWGCVMQAGEQALDIARTAVLAAGWPESVPGVTVDRQCGSSQQSIHFAAAGVVAGHYDVVVAGGVESMSRTPMAHHSPTVDTRTPRRSVIATAGPRTRASAPR
jgi:acetyl-CoA acyltransferase